MKRPDRATREYIDDRIRRVYGDLERLGIITLSTGTAGVKPLEFSFRYPYRINKAIFDSGGYPSPEILDEIAELDRVAGGCLVCGFKHPKIHPAFASGVPPGIIDKLVKPPDIPLNVRVAKALGYKVIRRQNGNWSMPRTSMEQEYIEYVPSYDTDLVAAMEALEEHCKKHNWYYEFLCFPDHPHRYSCTIKRYGCDVNESVDNDAVVECTRADTLPQAICEAIVKHSEGKC